MTYLVTMNPDTDYARTRVVADDDIDRVIRYSFPPYGRLVDGQAIMIRRADYIDTNDGVVVLSGTTGWSDQPRSVEVERPVRPLRLLQGGMDE